MSKAKSKPYADIGARLRQARQNVGIKQSTEIAKRLPCAISYISMIERGERLPSLEMFMQICRLINTSADWILFGEDYEPD